MIDIKLFGQTAYAKLTISDFSHLLSCQLSLAVTPTKGTSMSYAIQMVLVWCSPAKVAYAIVKLVAIQVAANFITFPFPVKCLQH